MTNDECFVIRHSSQSVLLAKPSHIILLQIAILTFFMTAGGFLLLTLVFAFSIVR